MFEKHNEPVATLEHRGQRVPVCKVTETPRTWSQGTLAYAHVNADGTFDRDSGNVHRTLRAVAAASNVLL